MTTAITPEVFLRRFFAPPNFIWPNTDPASPMATTMQPFLAALPDRGECPAVLPRRTDQSHPTIIYVVCWDIAHAGRVRPLLEAAVAHQWCRFDGRVARLDSADPIDLAVLDFVGPDTTFLLRPTVQTARNTFTALSRLIATIGDVPLRVPKAPRPIGRLLREFDLALASGAVATSERLLREIKAFGGISHENVAFLEIRRLFQLGKDEEVLAHASLPSLIYVEPPRLVREGVLAAWGRVNLARPLPTGDIDGALAAITTAKPDVAMLVDSSVASTTDPDASTVCALVALIRKEDSLTEVLAANLAVDPDLRARLVPSSQGSVDEADPVSETSIPESVTGPDRPATQAPIDSWLDWVGRLNSAHGLQLDGGQTLMWTPAWQVDSQLADAIDAVPEVATDDLLSGVAALLEADDLGRPAARTAEALLRRYLVAERFSPFDLGAICALLEIFLRGGPPPEAYREVLGDLSDFADRWVAIRSATRAIDLADAVVCGPVVDSRTRANFVTTLLSPLNQQRHRLPESLRKLASLVTDDIKLDYDWTIAASDPVEQPSDRNTASGRILLYSLDTGSLARVKKTIDFQWPNVQVEVSSALDGNASLKQHARNADLIVLATKRATHAATGFITANAQGALIRYADGSGSASLLRSVELGFADLHA